MDCTTIDCCPACHAGLLLHALPAACARLAADVSRDQQQSVSNSRAMQRHKVFLLAEHLLLMWTELCSFLTTDSPDIRVLTSIGSFLATLPSVANLTVVQLQRQLYYSPGNGAHGIGEAAAGSTVSVTHPAVTATAAEGMAKVVITQVIQGEMMSSCFQC